MRRTFPISKTCACTVTCIGVESAATRYGRTRGRCTDESARVRGRSSSLSVSVHMDEENI